MHDMSKSQGQNFYLVPHVPRIYGEYWWEKMPSYPTFSEQIRRIFVGQDAILSHVFRADTANICGTRCHLVPRFPSRYGEYSWDKMPSCPTFSEQIRRIFVGQDAILSHVFRADTANICGTRCHLVPRFPSRYGEYSWDKMPSLSLPTSFAYERMLFFVAGRRFDPWRSFSLPITTCPLPIDWQEERCGKNPLQDNAQCGIGNG